MEISEKVAYLKGLAEGLNLDTDSKEGKLIAAIIDVLDDMAETMRAADGVGLAAVQVGVLRRVVVIETEAGKLLELINPRIIESEGEQEEAEGCLSIPGKYGITHRPKKVVVLAENRHGETGKVELAWSPQYTTFSSLDYRHEED